MTTIYHVIDGITGTTVTECHHPEVAAKLAEKWCGQLGANRYYVVARETADQIKPLEAAMATLKSLNISPIDLLAYAITLDAKDICEDDNEDLTTLDALRINEDVENDSPSLVSALYLKAREIAIAIATTEN